MSRYASYEEAPTLAMQTIQGCNVHAFFDEFNMKGIVKYQLNAQGVQTLAGLMGVYILGIEKVEEESDENTLVLTAIASNPEGDKGFSYISQEVKEADFREKAYTRVKRNAMKDLVPHAVWCQMLVAVSKGTYQTPSPLPANQEKGSQDKEFNPVEDARRQARELADTPEVRERLKGFGINFTDCLNTATQLVGRIMDEFTVDDWLILMDILDDPVVAHGGVPKAVAAVKNETSEPEVSEESEEDVSEPEVSEESEEDVSDMEEDSSIHDTQTEFELENLPEESSKTVEGEVYVPDSEVESEDDLQQLMNEML